jgi:hypothetical protein
LQSLVRKIAEITGLTLNVWFLDDGTIAGKPEDVAKAIDLIKTLGPALGLFLNPAKSEQSWPSNCADLSFFPEFKNIPAEKITLLGAPCGSISESETFLSETFANFQPTFKALAELDDKQIAFCLLRYCMSYCKVVFFLRTVPPSHLQQMLAEFDTKVRFTLEALLARTTTEKAYQQACLGLKQGGLGLRKSSLHASAAYLASTLQCKELIAQVIPSQCPTIPEQKWLENYNSLVEPEGQLSLPITEVPKQHELSTFIDKASQKKLQQAYNSLLDKSHWRAVGKPHARDWLTVIPMKSLGLSLTGDEWRISALQWLALPVNDQELSCTACRSGVLDLKGYHALKCSTRGERIRRHNALRDVFYKATVTAQMGASLEQSHLMTNDKGKRPADIFIPNFSVGRGACLDFAVTSPFQQTNINEELPAKAYEQIKRTKYTQKVEREGFTFIPMIVETTGGWGPSAGPVFELVANRVAPRLGISIIEARHRLYQMMSICLYRCNARMILSRYFM